MKGLVPQHGGNESNEKRYLVVHENYEPAQFENPDSVRQYIEQMKLQGFTAPDVYEFDQQAGGWRKLGKV